ncbi:hypothetical protein ACHAWX_005556 [Stephanocyclus meneghinianus]
MNDVKDDNPTSSLSSLSPAEAAQSLFTNSTILAPMVRASTTPLRTLALHHGATLTYTEELIDRSIFPAERIVNSELGTVDYRIPIGHYPAKVQKRMMADGDNPDLCEGAVLLRIDPLVERDRLIYQIGTGESGLAMQAVERVVHDVAGVDVNMGCPKKFSVGGGMGSALLSDPKRACDILSTLRRNISKPVSAKIRLLHPTDPRPTLDFVRSLINAGANAIAIHGRIVGDESQINARWDTLVEVVKHLKETESGIPIIVNGDLYTHADIREMRRRSGCDGVMLARPALYNMGLFRNEEETDGRAKKEDEGVSNDEDEIPLSRFQTAKHSGYYGYTSPLLMSRTAMIQEYIARCVRYRTHSKNAKYVVCEMMNARRAPTSRVPFLDMGLEGGQTIASVCQCRSLEHLVKLWDVRWTIPLPSAAASADGEKSNDTVQGGSIARAAEGMGDLHNYDDRYFLDPEQFHKERVIGACEKDGKMDIGEDIDEKKSEDEGGDSLPVSKRPKLLNERK